MKARFAAPSRQLVVMFRGPPASYAKGTPRDGTKGRQHRWGGALGRGAAPDSQDGGRAAGKLARAPGAQRVGRPGGGALGRRSNRLVPCADANHPATKKRGAV